MTLTDEQQLLEKARTDPAHFAPVYDAYYPQIFGYVFRRTGDYELARDIAAETFLKAVLGLRYFKWRGVSAAAWLFRIATNEMRMFFRQKRYESTVFGQLPQDFVLEKKLHDIFEQEKAHIESQLERYQDFVKIQQALKTLGEKYQEVIALRYFEQKSIREIAEVLDKSEGTVKSLLARGVEKLKAQTT